MFLMSISITQRSIVLLVCAVFAIAAPGYAQGNQSWSARHLQQDREWAAKTGLPLPTMQQLRRAAGIGDDLPDTVIVHLDARTFQRRNQVLLVTAGGNGFCISAFVLEIDKADVRPVWSLSELPTGEGICRDNGTRPTVVAVSATSVRVSVPSHRHIKKYTYDWNGNTFVRSKK